LLRQIVHIAPCYVNIEKETGGVSNIVRRIAVEQVGLVSDVCVICPNVDLGQVVADQYDREVFGVKNKVVPFTYSKSDFENDLQSHNPSSTILHIHSCFSTFTDRALATATKLGFRSIFTPHGKLSPAALRTKYWRKRIWFQIFTKRYLKNSLVVCSSPQELSTLGIKQKRIHGTGWVENGFDPRDAEDFERNSERRCPYILFLGYVDPRKQPDFLIKAFAICKARESHDLVIAGPDAYGIEPLLRKQTEDLGVEDRVHFVGRVAGRRKWTLLRHARVMCLPSLGEGLPVVVSESLGAHTPILVSKYCNADHICSRGAGTSLKAFDLQQWASAIDQYCLDDSFRSEQSLCASVLSHEFKWSKIAARWVDVYEKALA
jgi:glycosyltransferase involved in cell wall biosynthesis